MRLFKKALAALIILSTILLISYLLSKVTQTKPHSSNVTSAVESISILRQPDAGRQPIIDAIDSASSDINIEVYLLSDQEVISALVRAHSKGINVKVILERHPFGGGSINPKTKKYLEEQKIPVRWSDPDFPLTHEKAIIIDNDTLFVLNQNLTTSSFSKNREYDIIDHDPQDIKEAADIFDADWNDTTFIPSDSHLIVSPINSRAGITNLISGSSQSIDMETEVISDPAVVNLLIEKSKKVRVRVLTPTVNQISSNKDTLVSLSNSGVEVRTTSSPYIHAKLILVDQTIAYTGSINLSSQSMDRNRELGIIMSKNDIITKLSNYFQTDWDNANPL